MDETKVCDTCLKRKPEGEFLFGYGRDRTCLKCQPYIDPGLEVIPESEEPADTEMSVRFCHGCWKYLPSHRFNPDPSDRWNGGIDRKCRGCRLAEKTDNPIVKKPSRSSPDGRKRRPKKKKEKRCR